MKNFLIIYRYSNLNAGIPDMVRKYSDFLVANGHKVYILSDHPDYKDIRGATQEGCREIYYLNLKNLFHFIFKKKIDSLLIFETRIKLVLVGILYKLLHLRMIMTLTFCGSGTERLNFISRSLLKIISPLFNHFTAISDYCRHKAFNGGLLKKTKLSYCPVDVEQYSVTTGLHDKILILVDRFGRRKRQNLLIEVFKKVHDVDPEVKLSIVGNYKRVTGDSNNRSKLNRFAEVVFDLIEKYDLKEAITVHGEVTDQEKIDLLAQSSIFVKTSEHEMQGISTLEGMASGLPVVAFDNSATGETVKLGGGISVLDGDVEAMAKAILELLSDPQKMETMSKQSKTGSRVVSGEVVLPDLMEILTTK